MSNQNDDGQGVMWTVLIGVVLLAISLAIGVGLYWTGKGAPAAGGASASATGVSGAAPAGGLAVSDAASGAANAAATAGVDGASVRVDNGVVKFYFASGRTELAAGAREALARAHHALGHQIAVPGVEAVDGGLDLFGRFVGVPLAERDDQEFVGCGVFAHMATPGGGCGLRCAGS